MSLENQYEFFSEACIVTLIFLKLHFSDGLSIIDSTFNSPSPRRELILVPCPDDSY
jgi:hypothetical protein